ncbi:MAG: hypothetical protein WDN44_16400 [Sphingomonas sp.]
MAVLPHPPVVPGTDKMQHFLAFAVLAALARAAYPRLSPLSILLGLSAFGGVIEIIQGIPAIHRDEDWLDWMTDTAAILAALAVAWLVGRRFRGAASRRRRRSGCPWRAA